MTPSKLLESVAAKTKDQNKGWIGSVIASILTLVAIFAFAWSSRKNAKELAKLKHEKNKLKVERENLEIEKKASNNSDNMFRINMKIGAHKQAIEDLDNMMDRAKNAHEENLKNINSITGWEDI